MITEGSTVVGVCHGSPEWDFERNETVPGEQTTPTTRLPGVVYVIAAAVAFVLSDEARYFCGSELVVDGGYSLQ